MKKLSKINKINNLNVIERENIDKLETLIKSSFKTEVRVDHEAVNKWRNQFL